MDTAKWYMLLRTNMKDSGSKTKNQEKEQWIGSTTAKSILESGRITSLMDTVSTFGTKIKLNIKFLRISIKAIGKMEKEKDLEPFFILTDANFKAIFTKTLSKDQAY